MNSIIKKINEKGELLIKVFISKIKESNKLEKIITCEAIIDTGANISAISNELIDNLQLTPISKGHINNILSDKMEIEFFDIWIGIILDEEKIFGKLGDGRRLNTEDEIKKILIDNKNLVRWCQARVVGVKNLNKNINTDNTCLIGTDIIQGGHLSVSNDTFIFSI